MLIPFGKSNKQRKIKKLLYHCKYPEKPRVLLLGPIGISAVNLGRTTINSGLTIKTGTNLLGLNK